MIRLGIIGTGGMANTHAESFTPMKGVRLAACCDIDPLRARRFAARWNIPKWYADHREMLATEALDAVSVVTVDAAHARVSLAAIARGLAVLCEKPLATSLADAKKMRDAARAAGVVTHVNFSYRSAPCVQAAAALIRRGGIGRVLHVEASYLQSWLVQETWGDWRTTDAFTWRLSRKHGSTGTLGDIGCHIYDLTAFLCGEISEIACRLATFDKGVADNRVGPYVLDANDSFVSTVRLAGGGIGTVHATRWASGQLNSLKVRVYGDEGALDVDLDRSREVYGLAKSKRAMRAASWKDVKSPKTLNQYERFIAALRRGVSDESDFANGARVQACLEASFTSDRKRKPVRVLA
ncbi:MAG: Gfo/Idh/MocA family oxidoreductase [Spirochaetia bacterium]|jgi:predicted dehydrogenase